MKKPSAASLPLPILDLRGKTILGIDPAIATIGYGAICDQTVLDYGVIVTPASSPVYQRLKQIHDDVCELCEALKPDFVAIEMPFFARENTNAGKVLRALGVIELAVAESGMTEPIFLHQSQVKSAVAQYGAEKSEIQQAVMMIFNLPELPKPDDAADGLAIAYTAQTGARANVR
ncbi:MAG: crossover junction endodeoxyribonuclease RuvC [Leptolyngbyaceae cyanobacterium SU_3_3]|nr:crossover junction endodeoxyribonuclease RuvC [Leptolyngbyaceae cyanobacterium SU_3_3]